MPIDYWRQLDVIAPREMETAHITLIGAGGIGSPTALALAKMGIKHLTVYDPDILEAHNFPNQLYPVQVYGYNTEANSLISSMGRYKIDALQSTLFQFCGLNIDPHGQAYESQPLTPIVICAVDSMATRKAIWDTIKRRGTVELYIEARMGAEVGMIYTLNPQDTAAQAFYEQQLYTDAQALPLPCTAQATIYNVFVLGGLICNQVKRYLKRQALHRELILDLANVSLYANGGEHA